MICHATGFNALAYKPLAARLCQHFSVWALDFRGHGQSSTPADGNFGWEAMATDLLAGVDALGAGEVHAFGHSMGGAAILLAERQRPGCIAGAYLYEPIVFPAAHFVTGQDNPLAESARRRREVFPSRAAALERYASRPPLNVLRADALAAYIEAGFDDLDDGTVRLACRAESEALTFETPEKLTIEELDGFALPVTIGIGLVAESPGPNDLGAPIVEQISGASLVEYEHLGHFGPLQAPDEVAADAVQALTVDG